MIIAIFVIWFGIGLNTASDAEYYHQYALGIQSYATSIWPQILYNLNQLNLYNRLTTTLFIIFLALIINPYLIIKIITNAISSNITLHQRNTLWKWQCFLLVYPSILLFSIDIYRDIPMLSILLLSFLFLTHLHNKPFVIKLILMLPPSYLLYEFREYLGASVLLALVASIFINIRTQKILVPSIIFIAILAILNSIGIFDALFDYREIFTTLEAGSTIGINFKSNPALFPLLFILSFAYQAMGLFIYNLYSLLLFLVESLPFVFCIVYLTRNRQYINSFTNYLLIFFVIYTSIWVIGNDNLGTAMRLRIISYITIYIAFAITYLQKNTHNLISSLRK